MGDEQRFTVQISDEAWAQIDAQVTYIAVEKRAPLNATRWLERLLDAIDTLETFPSRCPLDPAQTGMHGVAVHKLVFERTYVLRYVVDEVAREVTVVSFDHGATRNR